MPESARAFVILHHVLSDGEHWDLMLDQGHSLITWQLSGSPEALMLAGGLPACRIADHRRAYLAYEGPISGGRGQVTQVDSGTCEMTGEQTARAWTLRFRGRVVTGRFSIDAVVQGAAGTLRRLD